MYIASGWPADFSIRPDRAVFFHYKQKNKTAGRVAPYRSHSLFGILVAVRHTSPETLFAKCREVRHEKKTKTHRSGQILRS